MTDERDPAIQNLFDAARQDARDDAFVAEVMVRVNAQRRHTLYAWGAMATILLVVVALLAGPVTGAVGLLTRLMPQPLVEVDIGNALVNQVLAPLNSVSAVVGLGLLMLIFMLRKLFGRC